MLSITPAPPSLEECQSFCTQDPLLGNILVFIQLPPPTASFSRMEAHVLSCAGFQSYPRLTLDPTSPLYQAVSHLPQQKQNSEVYRGLAVGLYKYFTEIPRCVKEMVVRMQFGDPAAVGGFDGRHAGELASRMVKVDLSEQIYRNLATFLGERFLSFTDVDVVLKNVCIEDPTKIPSLYQRGLSLLGEESFLPTTRLKRSLSKPSQSGRRPDPKTLDYREDVLRQIGEFVETEASYVGKMREFLETVVQPLKERSQDQLLGMPKLDELKQLFPDCLERVVDENSRFFAKLEEAASKGITKFGAYCKDNFPSFRKPYEEYINASTDFPKVLAKLMGNRTSMFAKSIEEIGEQKMRSLLIEPVQRLPRYSLYIDNMLQILPEEHPAFQSLTSAREVISEICSLQSSSSSERNRVVERLQGLIPSWPARLRPAGRLITAVDCVEILPPFHEHSGESLSSMILLFPDCLVILRKPKSSSPVARAVQAEVDKPPGNGPVHVSRPTTSSGSELQFAGWVDTSDIRLSESDDGSTLWITTLHDLRDIWDIKNGVAGMRKMRLLNAYETRAGKLVEEFVKGKLERRVKDLLAVREIKQDPSTDLGFWIGVWGDESKWRKFAPKPGIVIFMADETASRSLRDKLASEMNAGVVLACIFDECKNKNRLDIRSFNDYSSSDTLSDDELLPVLMKRLATLQYRHTLPSHPPLTWAFISGYRRFLKSVGIPFEGESRIGKILRPASPVKLLSAFLGSGSGNTSPGKTRTLELRDGTMLSPSRPERMTSRRLNRENSNEEDAKVSLVGQADDPMSELKRLEKIFETYVEALKAVEDPDEFSKANFVAVEWDTVDKLHGEMLKNCSMELVKDTPAGVVFAAFLRFVRNEWKDKMGVLISRKGMDEIQEKSDAMYLQDFEAYLRGFLLELTPQNRRAFRSIVKLLATSIQRVENAADKGSLIASFTELLLEEDLNALDYMPLIDRLVEDVDTLFSDLPAQTFTGEATPMNGQAQGSLTRRLKSNSISNSVNSNTSLRKRFGFSNIGSIKSASTSAQKEKDKEHPPNDLSGKATSIWRTLSKGHGHSKSQDLSKRSHIHRSKSTDYDARMHAAQKRPQSRDRPAARTLFDNPPQLAPPASSSGMNSRPLSTIIYEELYKPPQSAPGEGRRKKRRSSLSDLLNAQQLSEYERTREEENLPSLQTFRPTYPLDLRYQNVENWVSPDAQLDHSSTAVPATPRSQIPRLSPFQANSTDSPRPSHTRNRSEITTPLRTGDKKENQLPSMLPRRPSTQSGMSGQPPPTPNQKFRVQNLKSLRDQSADISKKASDSESVLQAELDKIGRELGSSSGRSRGGSNSTSSRPLPRLGRSNTTTAALPSGSSHTSRPSTSNSSLKSTATNSGDINTRLASLEYSFNTTITDLRSDLSELDSSYSQLITQKDSELRSVQQLLEESQTENTMLYERFNTELGKIAESVAKGLSKEAVGREILRVLTEVRDDGVRVRKEVGRLRRENIALKSRLGM